MAKIIIDTDKFGDIVNHFATQVEYDAYMAKQREQRRHHDSQPGKFPCWVFETGVHDHDPVLVTVLILDSTELVSVDQVFAKISELDMANGKLKPGAEIPPQVNLLGSIKYYKRLFREAMR